MTPGEAPAQGNRADLRSWLEAAILSSDAALPLTPANTSQEMETEMEMAQDALRAATDSSAVARGGLATPTYKRKLATIRRITAVTTINNTYDVLAVDGWTVLAKEEHLFKAGKYVLFLEVDAFLPASSSFENLFAEVGPPITFGGETGYRVGTWMANWGNKEVTSQGHVFHLSDFPVINAKVSELHWTHIEMSEQAFTDFVRDIDFSADLGIKKWEPFPEVASDTVLNITALDLGSADNTGSEIEQRADAVEDHANTKTAHHGTASPASNPKPPSFIIKADMERAQNCPNLFKKKKYKHFIFQESLKMDGATMTIYFVTKDSGIAMPPLPPLEPANAHTFLKHAVHPNGRLGVCTRNQDLLPHLLPSKTARSHNHYWATAIAAQLHHILPGLGRNVAVQAELVGASIQGNPYDYPKTPGGPTHELFVFAVTEFAAMTSTRMHPRKVETFCRKHGLAHVPVTRYCTLPSIAGSHGDLATWAELKKGEGLVYKNCTDGRWFKVLSTRWIREKGDEMHAREQAKKARVSKEAWVAARKKAEGGFTCWLAPKEVVDEILDIHHNLEEWKARDERVRKWVEWMDGGCRGDWPGLVMMEGLEEMAGCQEANGTGNMADADHIDSQPETRSKGTDVNIAGAACSLNQAEANGQLGHENRQDRTFGVPEVGRDELVAWLGAEGFGLASNSAEAVGQIGSQAEITVKATDVDIMGATPSSTQAGVNGHCDCQDTQVEGSEAERTDLVAWLGAEGFGLLTERPPGARYWKHSRQWHRRYSASLRQSTIMITSSLTIINILRQQRLTILET